MYIDGVLHILICLCGIVFSTVSRSLLDIYMHIQQRHVLIIWLVEVHVHFHCTIVFMWHFKL